MADTPKMYRAYSIVPRRGQDDYWLNIGVAFPHEDGQGFNIMFQALPLPTGNGECKVVLRVYDQKEHEAEVEQRAKQATAKKRS
jgi:hypothetical protein